MGLGPEHDQPFEKEGWIAAFTGEILDFKYSHLDAQSDLEVLKDLWHPIGGPSLQQRDGFWSIGGIEPTSGSLYVLGDYLAQKPTYYRTDPPSAASELAPLLALAPTTLDEIYLAAVIKWGYCPETQRTPYQEIKRVLPGERILMSQKGYVRPRIVDPLLPEPHAAGVLKSSIEKATRLRVESSDVPVAALVSGGLDSSIVYTLAKRWRDIAVFHVENGEFDSVEKLVGDDYRPIVMEGVTLDHALDYMEEPIDLGSLIPQVALSDAMGDRYSVCLTGDGADEFFGGYGRSMRYDSQYSDVFQELVAWHLPRLDRVMMRNRIEVRSPFLSRWVAGKALARPWNQRQDKYALREIFRPELGSIVDTPKRPLRTSEVETGREERSIELVQMLRKRHGERIS